MSMNISRNFNPYGDYQKMFAKAKPEEQEENADVNTAAPDASQTSSTQDDKILNSMPMAYYAQMQIAAEQKPVENQDGVVNFSEPATEQPPEAPVESTENTPETDQPAKLPPYATGNPDVDNAIASSSENVQKYFTYDKQANDLNAQIDELNKNGAPDVSLEMKYHEATMQITMMKEFTLSKADKESIKSINKIKTDAAAAKAAATATPTPGGEAAALAAEMLKHRQGNKFPWG